MTAPWPLPCEGGGRRVRSRANAVGVAVSDKIEIAAATQHMPALDGLRGLAILMVIATHTAKGFGGTLGTLQRPAGLDSSFDLPHWLDRLANGGIHGVTLFFVVSAFTLMRQFEQRGLHDLSGYTLRRIFRIGPAFWLAGLAYLVIIGPGPREGAPAGNSLIDYLYGFTFTGWLGGSAAVTTVPGGWSVQTEVAFYVCLPGIVWLVQGRAWRAALAMVAATAVAQVMARVQMQTGLWSYEAYEVPLIQLPVFLMGVTAALIPRPKLGVLSRRFGAGLFTATLLGAAIVCVPLSPLRDWSALVHLQFAVLVSVATLWAAWWPPRFLTLAPLTSIGTVSYSLYLIHPALLLPVYTLVQMVVPGNGITAFVVYFITATLVSYPLAALSYRWIEQPPRRWIAARLRARQHSLQQPVTP